MFARVSCSDRDRSAGKVFERGGSKRSFPVETFFPVEVSIFCLLCSNWRSFESNTIMPRKRRQGTLTLKTSDKKRRRRQQQESEGENEARRFADRLRKAERRWRESAEENEVRRAADRERGSRRRRDESADETEARRAAGRERDSRRRRDESADETDARRAAGRERESRRRRDESADETDARRAAGRERESQRRRDESADETEARRAAGRERESQRRRDESADETEARRAAGRERESRRRRLQSTSETETRKAVAQEHQAEVLASTDHSAVLLQARDVQQEYAAALESLREHDSYAATVAFYAASPHGRGPAPTQEDVDARERLEQSIPNTIPKTTLGGAMRLFREQYNVNRINTCAACGKRDLDAFSEFSVDADEMRIFRLTGEAAATFHNRPKEEKRFINVYQSTSGHLYHFIPDLVHTSDGKEMVDLCRKCTEQSSSGRVPKISMANGVDFGRIAELPELSLLEKVVISPYRCYVTILKLKSPCGTNKLASQSCLRGHAVMFPHDGPDRLVDHMPRHAFNDVARDISIVFLGSRQHLAKKEKEIFDPKGPHAPLLSCNGRKVMMWLNAMRTLNHPAYRHLDAASWDLSEKTMAAVEELPTSLVRNAHCATGRFEAELEEAVTDDTARARPVGDINSSDSATAPAANGVDSVLLTPRDAPLRHCSAGAAIAQGVANLINAEDVQNVRSEPVVIHVNDREPVNEFTGDVILNGFPYLFLHGTGAPKHPDDARVHHMLLWHDGRFATDQRFVFYVYNMKQRWAAAQGVSAKVKSDRSAVESFNELITEPDFHRRLQNAVQHPSTPDARRLTKALKPLLSTSGQRVPFGPAERSATITRMCALVHYAGLPMWFWTISPSDVDNLLALRIAGVQFPPLPSLQTRAQVIARNPVAAARAFHELINSVLTNLFGLPAEEHHRKSSLPMSSDIRRSQPCVMCGQHCAAFYGVTETQGRGALHMHGILFCTVGPQLLQRCQADPQLASKLAALIDSVIVAQLPEDVHAARIERQRLGEPAERVGLRAGTDDIPLPDDDTDDGRAFAEWENTVISTTNVHTHSATCKKGKIGPTKCRLSFPRGEKLDGTGPVLLEKLWNAEDKDKGYTVVRSFTAIPPTLRHVDFSKTPVPAFAGQKDTTVIWELGRQAKDVNVVETATCLATNVAGNTNTQLLGSVSQAKGAMMYMFKYMSEDAHKLAVALPLLSEAMAVVRRRKSAADDRDTNPLRHAQMLLTRCLNSAAASIEVSAQQAASALLGVRSFISSHTFWYCFPWPAKEDVVTRWKDHTSQPCPSSTCGGCDTTDDESDDSDDGGHTDNATDEDCPSSDGGHADTAEPPDDLVSIIKDQVHGADSGTAEVYATEHGRLAVAQHTHYRYRGSALADMCLYEYSALMVVTRKQQQKQGPVQKDHQAEEQETKACADQHSAGCPPAHSGAGRPRNATYSFHPDHPLARSHEQQLRSKARVPVLAGRPPPPPPSVINETPTSMRLTERFASYYVALLVPWSTEHPFLPPVAPTYAGLCQWAETASQASCIGPPWLDRCRYDLLCNVTSALHVSNSEKDMSAAYRGRNAQVWKKLSGNPQDLESVGLQLDSEQNTSTSELREDHVAANSAAAITLLRQHFAEPADVGQTLVRHVLSTMDHLNTLQSTSSMAPPDVSCRLQDFLPSVTSSTNLLAKKAISDVSSYEPTPQQGRAERSAAVAGDAIRDPSSDLADECVPSTLSPPPGANLNEQQLSTFSMVTTWYVARQRHKRDPASSPCPEPLLLLVHGGPGTGKSHLAKTLASVLPHGSVSFSATTGVAAAALPDGRTLHNLLSLPLVDRKFTDLTPKARDTVQKNLGLADDGELSTSILVVDEVSMMTATQLAFIDHRLREVGHRTLPLGGMAVILMGDFYQLPPVGTEPIYRSALHPVAKRGAKQQAGAQLFKSFRLIELTQQMRAASCITQKDLVDNFRTRTNPIHQDDLAKLKVLTQRDIEDDPTWLDAVIVTPGNDVRHAINRDQAVRLAKRRQMPVLRWRLPLAEASSSNYPPHLMDAIYDRCPEAWGYFVPSAPVYLDFNYNPAIGLANGTVCVQDSITVDARTTDVNEVEDDWTHSAPGDFVTIPVPETVNLKLVGQAAEDYPADAPSLNNAWPPIIPVPGKGKTSFAFGPSIIASRTRTKKNRALAASTSGFELGFSITFHKMQGKTVRKIILLLQKCPRSQGTLTCAGLYVGLTRVRRNADMRVFPLPPGETLDHLCKLTVDPALSKWRQRYNNNGRWMEESG